MSRLKPNGGKIMSVDDANLVLKEIGLLEHELEKIDGAANKEIAAVKEKSAKQGEAIRGRIVTLSTLLNAYADYNRTELFRDKKTLELSFGSFGYRQSTAISVRKTTLELLRKLGLNEYIRVKEEPDKEAMKALDDERLSQVDAVRKVKDTFFCEANREEVNKELLKQQV
jgi:phage host-nuclease inhibitor protein Gam